MKTPKIARPLPAAKEPGPGKGRKPREASPKKGTPPNPGLKPGKFGKGC